MRYPCYLIMLITLVNVGCTSHSEFIRSLDFDIGRTIKEAGVPGPISVEPIDGQTSRYIFEYKDTGCRWSYTVNNQTTRVLSWEFLSEPKRCYTTTTFID